MKYENDFEESLAEKQAEYTNLLTQYRIMQGDRQAYGTESQKLISKQKAEIAALQNEKQELLKNLKHAGCVSNQKKDEKYCEDLANIADNKDWVENQITEQKLIQQQLDSQIKEAEEQIKAYKLASPGINADTDFVKKVRHKIDRLETRLENANKKYNMMNTKNQEIRSKIDHLRIERARFDVIYKRLDRKLTELRRENAELIETTTQAFHVREESQVRMTALKEKSQKDTISHNAEMKELIREIDHERKLSEFMAIKSTERTEDPQLVAWKQKKAKEATEKREAHLETAESYELAFQQMSHLTQEEDIGGIINVFNEREDENFSLFSYIHELRGLQEELMDHISSLESEVHNRTQNDYTEEATNAKKLEALIESNEAADAKVKNNAVRLKASYSLLELLMEDIKRLFDMIGTDRSSLDAKLASHDDITTYNVIEYLRLVENRMIELLRIANYIALRDADAPYDIRQCLMGSGPPIPYAAPKILPPSLAEDLSTADTDPTAMLPLKREDMKNAVLQLVRRKENEALAKPGMDGIQDG